VAAADRGADRLDDHDLAAMLMLRHRLSPPNPVCAAAFRATHVAASPSHTLLD
jgi:hypothetical protein